MPLKTLIGLILGNLIWSAHPLMGKYVLADFTPAQAAWLRYTGAFLSFCVFVAVMPRFRKPPYLFGRRRMEWLTVIVLGAASFCFSPLLQLTGLNASRATDNSLIIAMEPMITILLAWIFLKERITLLYSFALITALFGISLLGGVFSSGLQLSRSHLIGDLIMLVSLLGEGFYSIGGSKLVSRNSPITVFGWASFFGVIFLTLAVAVLSGQGPIALVEAAFHQMTWKSGLALAYLGPLGTAASYLYWMYALKEAPVASIALTLFIQPVFGSILGYLFLGERLSVSQSLGGVLIILAVFAQTLGSIYRGRMERQSVPAEI